MAEKKTILSPLTNQGWKNKLLVNIPTGNITEVSK